MLALVILEGIALAVLAVLVVGLLRSHAEVLRRLHELGAGIYDEDLPDHDHDHATAGVTSTIELSDKPDIRTLPGVAEPRPEATTPAHDLVGVTPAGSATAVGVAGTTHSTLIAFLSSGCGTCANFWEAFHAGDGLDLPGRDTRLVIVTKSPEHESQSTVQGLAPPSVTTIMSTAAFDDYGVPVNPYFILVDGPGNRVVGEGAAATWDQVANLMRQAVADAGLSTDLTPARSGRKGRQGDVTNENRDVRAEEELAAAGIGPGHPSLYPDQLPIEEEVS